MPQLVTSRREFAAVLVTLTTGTAPQPEPHQPRRIVAFGWISRNGGQVIVCDRLANSTAAAGR
jgi:hypothetical protein